jgi:hypothetical protein
MCRRPCRFTRSPRATWGTIHVAPPERASVDPWPCGATCSTAHVASCDCGVRHGRAGMWMHQRGSGDIPSETIGSVNTSAPRPAPSLARSRVHRGDRAAVAAEAAVAQHRRQRARLGKPWKGMDLMIAIRFSGAWILVPGLALGCGTTASSTSTDGGSEGNAGKLACGVAVYADPTCQDWLDGVCCAQEQACDAACRAIVACVNACPAPRTDACIGGCSSSANVAITAIGDCSKSAPPPSGQSCPWPS